MSFPPHLARLGYRRTQGNSGREPPASDRSSRPGLTAAPADGRVESAEHPFDTKV